MKTKRDSLMYLKKGGWRALVCLAVAALAATVWLLVSAADLPGLRADITPGRMYTLSEETFSVLSGLDEDVQLLLVADGEADERLSVLLSRYEAASARVRTGVISTAASVYWAGSAQEKGSVIVSGGGYEDVLPASAFTEAVYEGTGAQRTLVDERFAGERLLTGSIAYVTADLPIACVMNDHGETALEAGFLGILREQGFHTQGLYLSERGELPEGCALIISNVPLADLGADEAETVRSFLEEGGAFMLVTSGQNVADLANLGRVTALAGLTGVSGVVLEMDPYHVYSADYPYFLLPDTLETDVTASLLEARVPVLMSQAHAIAGEGEGFLPLLETTGDSYLKANVYADGDLAYAADDPLGPFCVAAMGTTAGGGHVFWIASPQCLADQIDALVGGANYRLAGSAIAAMGAAAPLQAPQIDSVSTWLTAPENGSSPLALCLLIALPLAALITGVVLSGRGRRGAKRP